MAVHGQNVWYELLTTDVDAAIRFYGEIMGWTTQPFEGSDPDAPYVMWTLGDRAIGGVMTLTEEASKMGATPHWMAYTAVDDVDEVAARVKQLGGAVHREPSDIPEVGRFAMLADPQGAAFSIFQALGDMPDNRSNAPGNFCWSELNTADYEAAWAFYSDLFDWRHHSSVDMGPSGTYFMFNDAAEATKGGMCNAAAQMSAPPHWLHYVTVPDINVALERTTQLGGSVLMGPTEIPGGEYIAHCRDPQGAAFAIYCES